MKNQRSKKRFSLDDSIDEDRRKEEIIQKLLESSPNLFPKKQPAIKFDLDENDVEVPKPEKIIAKEKKKVYIEYLTPQIVQNNLEMVKENLQIVISEKVEDSKCIKWFQLIVEFIKVMAYCNVLIQDKCSNQNSLWFFLMFIHDILEIAILIKIVNVVPNKFENQIQQRRLTQIKRESKYPMAGRHSYYGNILKEIDTWENQQITQNTIEYPKVKLISLEKYNQIFYLILVIWGLIQLGQVCQSDIVLYTFQGFIFLGIITLIIKLMLFLSFKFCIGAVVLNYLMLTDKNYQSNEIIQNLQKITKTNYDPEICYLCSNQIKHLTVYIDLPCNKMHRFHEKCIISWLKSHLFCPVCVEPIELINFQLKVLS